mmetsp:Transcript_14258/g.15467  ORF Transcript_14258/g.15467 Transcript_14258/m.15467 type:complete len:335 (+) Transcript_14258:48-1052(+)
MKLATKSLFLYSFFAKIPASQGIVGGEIVEDTNEYPYFVSAPFEGCGGVLIAPDVVLTASRCSFSFEQEIFIGGTVWQTDILHDGEPRTCIEWISDPEYVDSNGNQDFALCKLNKPVTSIQPIKLHDGSDALSNGQELLVMGHGNTESYWTRGMGSKELLDTTVQYTDDYESFFPPNSSFQGSQMFAGNLDEEGLSIGGSCRGDTGGPLVWRKDGIDTVVGVVSFPIIRGEPCLGLPMKYARVSYRYDWIMETMRTLSDFPTVNCQDDPEWEFREKAGQTCKWFQKEMYNISNDPVKFCGKTANGTGRLNADKTKVWAYCKQTCYLLGNTNSCK